MAIALSCSCGKDFNVKDELAGKKIKCPGCHAVIQVPAPSSGVTERAPSSRAAKETIEDDDLPPAKASRKAAADEYDDDYDDDSPARGIKKKKKKKGKKSAKPMLLVGLGCGALALLLACGGGGAALYFFVFSSKPPERVMLGKWKVDVEETKKNMTETEKKQLEFAPNLLTSITLEFKSDNTMIIGFGEITIKGKWKWIRTKGNTATLEVTNTNSNKNETNELEITAINNDRIRIVTINKKGGSSGSKEDMVMKRY
jgi:hypothetical protein